MAQQMVTRGRLRQEDHKFEASLGYIVRAYFKKQKASKQERRKRGWVWWFTSIIPALREV
jgi:hypothetical protein